jgi:hypothetical protein
MEWSHNVEFKRLKRVATVLDARLAVETLGPSRHGRPGPAGMSVQQIETIRA